MIIQRTLRGLAAFGLLTVGFADARAGITVDSTPFVGVPTLFNGFEKIPNDGTFFTAPIGTPYTEGGITVQQVNSDNRIWVTFFHPQGNFGWYPDGGDEGHTEITPASGKFFDVGFSVATGALLGSTNLNYEVWNDGQLVTSGTVLDPLPSGDTDHGGSSAYVHFYGDNGDEFDTIKVWDDYSGQNQLAIDDISANGTIIPEPGSLATWALLAVGLIGCTGYLRKSGAPIAAETAR